MKLPYTPKEAEAAHRDWKAMCGHFSIAAATGISLDRICGTGVPLKGWMNPTMVSQTLHQLQVLHAYNLLGNTSYATPTNDDSILHDFQPCILRIQWEGSWLNPGVPIGARYQRTHYIACEYGTIMDPAFDANVILRAQDWLQVVAQDIVTQIKGATGYHFTHAWFMQPTR